MPTIKQIAKLDRKYQESKKLFDANATITSTNNLLILQGIIDDLNQSLKILSEIHDRNADDYRREIRYRDLLHNVYACMEVRYGYPEGNYDEQIIKICELYASPVLASVYTDEERRRYAGLLNLKSACCTNLTEAVSLIEKSTKLFFEIKEKTSDDLWTICNNYRYIGGIYQQVGDYFQACQYLYRSLEGFMNIAASEDCLESTAESLKLAMKCLKSRIDFQEQAREHALNLVPVRPLSLASVDYPTATIEKQFLMYDALLQKVYNQPEIRSALRRFSHFNKASLPPEVPTSDVDFVSTQRPMN